MTPFFRSRCVCDIWVYQFPKKRFLAKSSKPALYRGSPPDCALWGFGVSTWPIGCDTPSPFSERFPLGEHAKWRCDTPPPRKRGISAILARYPMKTRQMGAIPPSAILSRKGIARYGGVSRTGPLRALSGVVTSYLSVSYLFYIL